MRHRGIVPLLAALTACATTSQIKNVEGGKGIETGDLDKRADPCTDFYQFANGSWRAGNPIPASMQRWSRRWAAGEANKGQLRDILEEVSKKRDWPAGSNEQLISDHYSTCMDVAKVDAAGIAPLRPMLSEIEGLQSVAEAQRMIGKLHKIFVFAPFVSYASPDNHQPSQTLANVAAAGLGLPDRDYYLKPEPRFVDAREKYRAHVAAVFKLAGVPGEEAAAETVLAFERRLAEASLDNVALRDPAATDHKSSFADLEKLAPHFDWKAYFDEAKLPRAELNVAEPKFLQQFDKELGETSLADWKTYLKWQLLDSASPWLSQPFVEESFNFRDKYLGGVKEMKPRWKICAESTDQLLGEALGRKYVEKHFPPAAKARVQEMVKNLLSGMRDAIGELDWMGPETKERALEKLSTFQIKIGYPDNWKDYSSVKIGRESLWTNVVSGRKFVVEDDRAQVGKPTDRSRWGMTPPTSDASYNALLNDITFPAGILQPPAFSLQATDALNYGAIGVVIGHEVSHGFDDQGAQFDAQGRLHNWWTESDLKQFQQRGQCVADQFEGYFIEPGIHHNGKLVLGESIGDLGGARIAWLAFKKALAASPEPDVDGFTPEQQFFIAWGQFRGDEIRQETQRLMIQGDPHPIAKFRVNGPLSNRPEFQKAFSCKADAAMVRQARCNVW
jgi:putative endopeptidase